MGRRGPYGELIQLKELKGNLGKRKLDAEPGLALPVVAPTTPFELTAPAHLSSAEGEMFARICRVLAFAKVITEADQEIITRYVEMYSQYQNARRAVQQLQSSETAPGQVAYVVHAGHEMVKKVDEHGKEIEVPGKMRLRSVRLFPQIKAMIELSNHLLRLERELGLTPAARSMWGKTKGAGDGDGESGDDGVLD